MCAIKVVSVEGCNHSDRGAQLQYLNNQINTFLAPGWPGVSVNANKKGRVGAFKTVRRECGPQYRPEEVHEA